MKKQPREKRRQKRQEMLALMRESKAIKKKAGLCTCSAEEVKKFDSDEESIAARGDAALICDACGKERLRIAMVQAADGGALKAGDVHRALRL